MMKEQLQFNSLTTESSPYEKSPKIQTTKHGPVKFKNGRIRPSNVPKPLLLTTHPKIVPILRTTDSKPHMNTERKRIRPKKHKFNSSNNPSSSSETFPRRQVSFDQNAIVYEFNRADDNDARLLWFCPADIKRFKAEVAEQKRLETSKILRLASPLWINEIFSLPTPSQVNDSISCSSTQASTSKYFNNSLQQEIRSVLIIDTHSIFLHLLTKSILSIMPHVSVKTCHTGEEGLRKCCHEKFDMIVVEERLNNQKVNQRQCFPSFCSLIQSSFLTGSQFFGRISQQTKVHNKQQTAKLPLLVGMTSCPEKDSTVLKNGGADLVWQKPPPPMDDNLTCLILETILQKRSKN